MCGGLTWYTSADVDLFTRVAVGRLIVTSGEVPLQDPFSYSLRKAVWHDHEIIPGLLFYVTSQQAGDLGLFTLKIVFAVVTLLVIINAQRSANNGSVVGTLLLAALLPDLMLIWTPTVRAQVITFLCYAVFLWVFVRVRVRDQRALMLLLPLVEIVWVNSHGGFIIGILFTCVFVSAMYLERRLSWPLLVGLGGVITAPFVNPYGVSFLAFIFGAVTRLPTELYEWYALRPWSAHGVCFYGALGVALLGWRAYRRIPLEGRFFLIVTAYQGARHERLAPLFSIALLIYGVPFLESGLTRIREALPRLSLTVMRSFVAAACLIVVACSIRLLYFLCCRAEGFSLGYAGYPRSAVEWLRDTQPGGRILTHYNDGSYVLWRMGEKFKLSLDGRYDGVYPPETIKLGFDAYSGAGKDQGRALAFFDPDYVLLGPTTPGLCEVGNALRDEMFPRFELVFSADGFCVLSRKGGERASGIVTSYPRPAAMWAPLW